MRLISLAALVASFGCSLEERGSAAAAGGAADDSGKGGKGGSIATGGGGFGGTGGSGGIKDGALDVASGGTIGVGGEPGDGAPTGGAAGSGGTDASVGLDCNSYPGSSPFVVNGNKHCYWRSAVAGKFVDAVANCSAPSVYLVSIHSAEENEFVRGLAGIDSLWIGVTDNKNSDDPSCGASNFGWTSGEALTYTNWTDNNPDCVCGNCDGNCDCQHRGAMLPDGGWRDRFDGDAYFWICEVGPLVP